MKQYICQFILIIVTINSVFAINSTFCLEETVQNSNHQYPIQRKSITLGIPLTHFSPKSNNNGLEYNMKVINPGVEALLNYSLSNSTSFTTGLSYQYNKITYWEHSFDIKTITNEISIPLLISLKLFQSTVSDMELFAGFYLGQYVSIINHTNIFEENKKNYAKLFSVDDFIGDIYVAIGKKLILKKIPIGVDLFFRYRLKEHHLVNSEVSRSFYGIKLKYGFNL